MTIKGTYRCDTTQHPDTLNSWDIRSVSVDLPEEEKQTLLDQSWNGGDRVYLGDAGVVSGVWVLKMSTYKKRLGSRRYSGKNTILY